MPDQELKALAESLLQKLNLVSREEFDAQRAVLARTREKVEAGAEYIITQPVFAVDPLLKFLDEIEYLNIPVKFLRILYLLF